MLNVRFYYKFKQ